MAQGLTLALAATLAMASTWFSGCDRHPVDPSDGGPFARRDAHVPEDALHDAGPPPTLGPCTETSACGAGTGVTCLTNVPGGACTQRCGDDSECGAGATCVANLCLWACQPGTGECVRHAGACLSTMSGAYCAPICYPAGHEPPGYPSCGPGLVCDAYSSTCVTTLGTGAENGAPCRDGVECRGGDCFVQDDLRGGGFYQGMCVSYGITQNSASIVPGGHVPQGSCPNGSAEIDSSFASSPGGDLGICFPTCTTDGQCRVGYACTHLETFSPPLVEGFCLPLDCTMQACPGGTTCSSTSPSWTGHPVCVRTP
jgi:hypothetical protein